MIQMRLQEYIVIGRRDAPAMRAKLPIIKDFECNRIFVLYAPSKDRSFAYRAIDDYLSKLLIICLNSTKK